MYYNDRNTEGKQQISETTRDESKIKKKIANANDQKTTKMLNKINFMMF